MPTFTTGVAFRLCLPGGVLTWLALCFCRIHEVQRHGPAFDTTLLSRAVTSAGVWELLDRAKASMGLQQQPAPEMTVEQRVMLAAADREQRLDRMVGPPPEPPLPPQGLVHTSCPLHPYCCRIMGKAAFPIWKLTQLWLRSDGMHAKASPAGQCSDSRCGDTECMNVARSQQ